MNKYIKITISIAILSALIATAFFALFPSDYSTPRKYKENMFSNGPVTRMTKGKQKFAQKLKHSTKVTVTSDEIANLGDFIFNSGGKTKIVSNISLKFENTEDGWFNGDDAKKEILKRGVIIRSAIIDTMMDNHGQKSNDDRIKAQLLDNINYHLSDATATEIYFNKFIVQH